PRVAFPIRAPRAPSLQPKADTHEPHCRSVARGFQASSGALSPLGADRGLRAQPQLSDRGRRGPCRRDAAPGDLRRRARARRPRGPLMGLLNNLISRRNAMPDQSHAITRLRKASYALEDLPETIALPQRPGDEPHEPLPVVEASVDEIAFAIVQAERESSAAYRRAATAVMKKDGQ